VKLAASNQLRERHPEVPWRRIADFRNVAVHQYFAIEWSLVWRLLPNCGCAVNSTVATCIGSGHVGGVEFTAQIGNRLSGVWYGIGCRFYDLRSSR
jgi:Protein of unknown function DUF86